MSFLYGLAAKLVEWLLEKAWAALSRVISLWSKNSDSEAKNQKIADEAKSAQTKEERDNAAKDVFKDI